MSVDRGITSGSSKILAVLVRDVLTFAVFIAFCETEVDDVDLVFCLVSSADQEVIRLDIPVDNTFFVHFLNAHQLNIYG